MERRHDGASSSEADNPPDAALVRAAAALGAATHLLVAAGAGCSADSGLPVYADVARIPLWEGRGLDYANLCDTRMLLARPACGYGFWSGCSRAYLETMPHEGYAILERWAACKPPDNVATYTSNVDGHFRRFASLSRKLTEIHGCAEEWVCGATMLAEHQRLEAAAAAAAAASSAEEAAATQVRVFASQRTREEDPPPCASALVRPTQQDVARLERHCLRALAAEIAGGGGSGGGGGGGGNGGGGGDEVAEGAIEAEGSSWSQLPPRCAECAAPLRPSVLMFGDPDTVLISRLAAAADQYQAWEDAMEEAVVSDTRLSVVVLELGCGTNVPSVRDECECVVRDVASRGGRALLVRVNLDEEAAHTSNPNAPAAEYEVMQVERADDDGVDLSALTIVIRDTALRALRHIDALMSDSEADQ